MKVIIEHSATSRKISGAFKVYGNRADLEAIQKQIKAALDADPKLASGWIEIVDDVTTADTAPIVEWDMG